MSVKVPCNCCLPIRYLLLAVCRSAIWCLETVYWTQGPVNCHPLGVLPQPGSPQGPRVSLKNHQMSSLSPRPFPGSPKTWTWNLSAILTSRITEKSQTYYAQSEPQKSPKCSLKSTKMDTWTPRCMLGVPVEPWITKIITQGAPNGASRSPKYTVCALKNELSGTEKNT